MSLKRLRDQAALATGNFGRLFGRLELPPLPGVATRLLALMRSEDVEFSDLATVIASDAGIATRVLRTVNAAGVGLSRQITDIQQAISVLGLNRIRDLVLAYAALDALPLDLGRTYGGLGVTYGIGDCRFRCGCISSEFCEDHIPVVRD